MFFYFIELFGHCHYLCHDIRSLLRDAGKEFCHGAANGIEQFEKIQGREKGPLDQADQIIEITVIEIVPDFNRFKFSFSMGSIEPLISEFQVA
jgi:hypothetical protein